MTEETQAPDRRRPIVIAAIVVLIAAISVAPFLIPRRAPAPAAPTASSDPLDPYRGLGTWVSIYDRRAWADPEAAVADMASHRVHTLFLQTGNTNSAGTVYMPAGQEAFIRAAHARGMKVVAWYLPEMTDLAHDYERVTAAIGFTTSDGQTFDSFALDIESTKVRPVSARNVALAEFTRMIRGRVGDGYVLGAIVPSPTGIAKNAGFWNDFPYGTVAGDFDVMLPMGYYTYHGNGAAAAAADVTASVAIIRSQPGGETVPIHFIGGLAAKTDAAELSAFAGAANGSGCIGASLYSWSATTPPKWEALQAVVR